MKMGTVWSENKYCEVIDFDQFGLTQTFNAKQGKILKSVYLAMFRMVKKNFLNRKILTTKIFLKNLFCAVCLAVCLLCEHGRGTAGDMA